MLAFLALKSSSRTFSSHASPCRRLMLSSASFLAPFVPISVVQRTSRSISILSKLSLKTWWPTYKSSSFFLVEERSALTLVFCLESSWFWLSNFFNMTLHSMDPGKRFYGLTHFSTLVTHYSHVRAIIITAESTVTTEPMLFRRWIS